MLDSARTSIVPEIRGPRTRRLAKRSFAAEAAAGDLMVVEDGAAPRARKESEKVAEIPC